MLDRVHAAVILLLERSNSDVNGGILSDRNQGVFLCASLNGFAVQSSSGCHWSQSFSAREGDKSKMVSPCAAACT
jgi:hypothetical protein